MDVTSLYTNIPQEDGINSMCKAYVSHYKDRPLIPTQSLELALRLILKENSLPFLWNKLPPNSRDSDGNEGRAFANISKAKVET